MYFSYITRERWVARESTYRSRSLERAAKKHGVMPGEVLECIQNKLYGRLIDDRAENRTFPSTRWFLAETDSGRKLKVVFLFDKKFQRFVLKTAYEPNMQEEKIYGTNFPGYQT